MSTVRSIVRGVLLAALAAFGAGVSAAQDDLAAALAAQDRGDYEAAAVLLLPLADAGDPQAQFALALLVEAGRGVPQDRERAIVLFTLAAAGGVEGAVARLEALRAGMAPPADADRGPVPRPGRAPAPLAPAAPRAPAAPLAAAAPRSKTAPVAPDAPRAPVFRRQAPDAYTLQVASVALESAAAALAERLDEALDLDVFVVAYAAGDGALRHAVLVGVFASRDAASRSVGLLLPLATGGEPWPRRIGDVQALMPVP
jgi:TPR repeat protein